MIACPQCKPGDVVGADGDIYEWHPSIYRTQCSGQLGGSARCGAPYLVEAGFWDLGQANPWAILNTAAGVMNDWRTYAGWYGGSVLTGAGGAVVANLRLMHVAVGTLEGNVHFAFEAEGTWMHGLLIPGTDEVVATEGLAEGFANGAVRIPVPVLYPEVVLPEVGTSMTNCFTGMCSAVLRGWSF